MSEQSLRNITTDEDNNKVEPEPLKNPIKRHLKEHWILKETSVPQVLPTFTATVTTTGMADALSLNSGASSGTVIAAGTPSGAGGQQAKVLQPGSQQQAVQVEQPPLLQPGGLGD